MTPDELAAQLGYSGKTIRAWLRGFRPRDESAKHTLWSLTIEDEAAVRRAFAEKQSGVGRYFARAAEIEAPVAPVLSADRDWYWEGNVQAALARHLESERWSIECLADTARKEHGDDIRARKGDRVLRVEVKGWPTKGRYADLRRAGETKRAQPSTQAGHWYSQALLQVLRDLGAEPSDEAAIALPDWPRFRSLVAATEIPLRRLGVGVFFVGTDGSVEEHLPHGQPGQKPTRRSGRSDATSRGARGAQSAR
jgi:hypothetical protein